MGRAGELAWEELSDRLEKAQEGGFGSKADDELLLRHARQVLDHVDHLVVVVVDDDVQTRDDVEASGDLLQVAREEARRHRALCPAGSSLEPREIRQRERERERERETVVRER